MVRANKDKRLKVLLVNGSPHRSGNTFTALSEVARTLEEEGLEAEIVHVGNRPVQGCIGCYKCREKGVCVFQDETYLTLREKLAEADGITVRQSISADRREASVPCSTACSIPAAGWHSTSRRHLWWSAVAEEPPPLSTG